jgi:hypothetical protein
MLELKPSSGQGFCAMTAPSPLCRGTIVFKNNLMLIAFREFVNDSRMGRPSVQGAYKRVKCSISYYLCSGFLCENGSPHFSTCVGYLILLLVGSAYLGHRRLHSSCPIHFNKRHKTSSVAYWRTSQSWIALPYFFGILE